MDNKIYTLSLIGAGIVLIIIGGLLGWNLKPVKVCPIIIDSVLVKGDPYPVYRDTTIYITSSQPAETVNDSIKQTTFTETVVSHQDTITITSVVEYNPVKDIFNLAQKIDHKDYSFNRVDTLKIKVVETFYIPTEQPFYDTFSFGSILTLVLVLIGVLVF